MIEMIPLSRLHLSPLNPRKTRSEGAINAMIDSIREIGMQQNLIGYPHDATHGGAFIVGGGTRLLALMELGDTSMSVPVMVYPDSATALAAAVAENEVRQAMTPVDRVRAYKGQADAGRSLAQIAAAYGASVLDVRRHIALASVATEVLDALAADKLSLDMAVAFTVSTDHDAQRKVLAQVLSGATGRWPHNIKAQLKSGAIEASRSGKLAFIGRELYLAAGGTLTEDLFSENIYVENPELLDKLVAEQIDAQADELEADGWLWAEAEPDPLDWSSIRSVPGTPVVLSPEDTARYDELMARFDGDENIDEDDPDYIELQRLEELSGVIEYSDDAKSVSGVYIRIDYDGTLGFRMGIVKPDDMERAIELGLIKAKATTNEATKAEDSGLSASLVQDLQGVRTIAAMNALADKPELALDVLAWVVSEMWSGSPLNITHRDGDTFAATEKTTVRVSEALQEWAPGMGDEALSLAAFREQGKKNRNAVLAGWIASALTAAGATLRFEQIEEACGASIRKDWTPGPDLFKRLNMAQAAAVFEQVTGVEYKAINPKAKKADLEAALTSAFGGPAAFVKKLAESGIEHAPDAVDRLKTWVPDVMLPTAQPAEPEALAAE